MLEPVARDRLHPDFAKAVNRAEKQDGYVYGPVIYIDETGMFEQAFINVSLYPKRRWWLQFLD